MSLHGSVGQMRNEEVIGMLWTVSSRRLAKTGVERRKRAPAGVLELGPAGSMWSGGASYRCSKVCPGGRGKLLPASAGMSPFVVHLAAMRARRGSFRSPYCSPPQRRTRWSPRGACQGLFGACWSCSEIAVPDSSLSFFVLRRLRRVRVSGLVLLWFGAWHLTREHSVTAAIGLAYNISACCH